MIAYKETTLTDVSYNFPQPSDVGFCPTHAGPVYFEVYGGCSGPAAVVFHGGPGSGLTVEHAIPLLQEGYRVFLFDQPGSLRSPAIYPKTSAQSVAKAAGELMAYHSVKNFDIVGYSSGALVALIFASDPVHNIGSIISIHTCLFDDAFDHAFTCSHHVPMSLRTLNGVWTENASVSINKKRLLKRFDAGSDEEIVKLSADLNFYEAALCGRFDDLRRNNKISLWPNFIARSRCLVDMWLRDSTHRPPIEIKRERRYLFLHGRNDHVAPIESVRSLSDRSGASLYIYPCGHHPMELRDRIAEDAIKFLRSA